MSEKAAQSKLKHFAFFAVLIAANLMVFAAPAQAREEGPKGCYHDGTGNCKCEEARVFPVCSSASECVEIFTQQCKKAQE